MPTARKDHRCDGCQLKILQGAVYARKGSKKYHLECAPKDAKVGNADDAYPFARRSMKKILKVGSVRGFFR